MLKLIAFIMFAPLILPFIVLGFVFDFAKCGFEIGIDISQSVSDYLARLK